MSSPFPGMDPCIETPELWPNFQTNLAVDLRARLNQLIGLRYFARLTCCTTYDTVDSRIPLEIPLRLNSVEISATGTEQWVTVIEILSPVNKRPGHDAYT